VDRTRTVDDVLSHFGVLGMKWGHRKASDASSPAGQAKIKKDDAKFEKMAGKFKTQKQIWHKAIVGFKDSPELKAINEKPKYSQTRRFKWGLTTNRALYKNYNDEVAAAFLKRLDDTAQGFTNASGTRQYRVKRQFPSKLVRERDNHWKVVASNVQHDDGAMEIEVIRDKQGFVLELRTMEIMQSDSANDFLAHFGVLGMKWGKRKARPVSAEARQKANIKDRVKKNKVASVSNADLQTAIRRMQLEQDFKRLKVNEQSGVTRWLSSTLLEIGKREVQTLAAKKVAAVVAKKVATGGAA
jgi:hypothetical protein